MLPKGDHVKVGDEIVIHPTADGEYVTHGNSRIGVGDEVVIVRLKDGDLAGLNGAINTHRDCQIIRKVRHDHSQAHDPPDDTKQFYAYTFDLERPIKRLPGGGWPVVNMRMDLRVIKDGRGFQCWYPYGGVWLGVSQDGENYWWCMGTDSPYKVIAGGPAFNCVNGPIWSVENWLQACPQCCPPPAGIDEINYVHVHIHTASSLYWKNYVKTDLLYLTLCEGTVREGWDNPLDDLGIPEVPE